MPENYDQAITELLAYVEQMEAEYGESLWAEAWEEIESHVEAHLSRIS